MANNFELTFPAGSFCLPASNHPDLVQIQDQVVLAYDDSTEETSYSPNFRCPANLSGGTLKADIHYIMASATSGTVEFEVTLEAVTDGDEEDLDAGTGFDTANAGSASVPSTAGFLDVITVTLSNKDSIAAADKARLGLKRDADDGSNDTASGDARVFFVTLYEEA